MTLLLKIVLEGDVAVGKKTLMDLHLGGLAQPDYMRNSGFKISFKNINIDGIPFKFHFWLISERNVYSMRRLTNFGNLHGAILLFDASKPISFNILEKFIKEITNSSKDSQIPIAIYGNIREETTRIISEMQGKNFVNKLNESSPYQGHFFYFEGSVLNENHIVNVLEFLGRSINSREITRSNQKLIS